MEKAYYVEKYSDHVDKRDAIRKEEILSAVVKNEWQSYEEIMNFLNVGSDGEKKEK